jgi:hypothetical protein
MRLGRCKFRWFGRHSWTHACVHLLMHTQRKAVLLSRNSTFGACSCRSLHHKTASLTIRCDGTSKHGSQKHQIDCFQAHVVILSLSETSLMHLNIFQFSVFNNIVVNSLTNSCTSMGKSKRLFVISSKHRQISVQNSNVEHHFVILQIRIGRTPYEGSRDDTQVRGELTHRSTMTRLTGRQRQWLAVPATSTMTHGSTHPLVNLSPKTRHAFNTVEQASLS